jgi:hypothetical protein
MITEKNASTCMTSSSRQYQSSRGGPHVITSGLIISDVVISGIIISGVIMRLPHSTAMITEKNVRHHGMSSAMGCGYSPKTPPQALTDVRGTEPTSVTTSLLLITWEATNAGMKPVRLIVNAGILMTMMYRADVLMY